MQCQLQTLSSVAAVLSFSRAFLEKEPGVNEQKSQYSSRIGAKVGLRIKNETTTTATNKAKQNKKANKKRHLVHFAIIISHFYVLCSLVNIFLK